MVKNQLEPSPQKTSPKVFSGVRWSGVSQIVQQLLNIGFTVVMARLLAPEDFGLLAMASVFTGVVFLVLDLGLGSAIVQAPKIEEKQLSSIFWMNVFAGIVMTLVGIFISGAIASFYKTPAVQPIVIGLSFNFLIFSLSSTQQSLLIRQMDFQGLELRNMGGQLIGTLGAIAIAFAGGGVWSLVARILITGLVSLVLLWSVSGWRPQWVLRWVDVRQFAGFSTDVLGTSILTYVGRNADNLLIGRFIGTIELGYYALAYNVMRLSVQRFSQVLGQVLFPALSRLQEDREKVKHNWLRANRLTGAVLAPLMLGLIAVAPEFVEVLYGRRWLPVVPILRVLAIAGLVQAFNTLSSTLLLSLGQTRLRVKLAMVSIVLALVSFGVGLPYGSLGVATCFTGVSTATAAWYQFKTLQCIRSNFAEFFRGLVGIGVAVVGMELVVSGVRLMPLPAVYRLAIAVFMGGVTYLSLLWFTEPRIFVEAKNILPKRFSQTKPD